MIALRDKPMKIFGATLAGLALYLQFVFAGWGMLALATRAEPADPLGGHALCLAAESGAPQPAAPAGDSPSTPAHDHLAFCCLWHSMPGVAPQTALLPQPVAYAAIGHDEPGHTALIPGPPHGPANARAPPTLT
jgi:hypothetical protein